MSWIAELAPATIGSIPPAVDVLERFDVPYPETVAAIVVFFGVFLLLYILGRLLLSPLFAHMLDARALDPHAIRPLAKLFNLVLLLTAVAIAFGVAGFGRLLTSLAAIAAAATLAVGFAMQDVIRNFVAGVLIFADKPFRIGDWIEWDDEAGVVEDISLRVTRVRTFDNELLTVPNAVLTEGVIKNPVAYDRLRLRYLFGIGYDDDIDAATDVILAEASDHPGILEEPEPSVRVVELGDSSVGLQARIWIGDPSRSDFVAIKGEFVQAVKERFDREGISMPYPNRTLEGELDIHSFEGTLVERGE